MKVRTLKNLERFKFSSNVGINYWLWLIVDMLWEHSGIIYLLWRKIRTFFSTSRKPLEYIIGKRCLAYHPSQVKAWKPSEFPLWATHVLYKMNIYRWALAGFALQSLTGTIHIECRRCIRLDRLDLGSGRQMASEVCSQVLCLAILIACVWHV